VRRQIRALVEEAEDGCEELGDALCCLGERVRIGRDHALAVGRHAKLEIGEHRRPSVSDREELTLIAHAEMLQEQVDRMALTSLGGEMQCGIEHVRAAAEGVCKAPWSILPLDDQHVPAGLRKQRGNG
jgi:hypothetical protein